ATSDAAAAAPAPHRRAPAPRPQSRAASSTRRPGSSGRCVPRAAGALRSWVEARIGVEGTLALLLGQLTVEGVAAARLLLQVTHEERQRQGQHAGAHQ